MRPPEAVSRFVRDALAAGRSRDEIAAALRQAGWSGAEVRAGLGAWADAGTLPPVPRPREALSARDALAHAVLFLALGIAAVNLGVVCFSLIDRWVADPLADPGFGAGARVRWAVAALAVAWPVWARLTLSVAAKAEADPGRRRSAVGRWLTAAALFIAAVIVLGDLVVVVANFLGGEVRTRFLLKAATVAAIAGAVSVIYAPGLGAGDEA
jgi:Domain of unknown function (DUF5671)